MADEAAKIGELLHEAAETVENEPSGRWEDHDAAELARHFSGRG